MYTFFGSCLTDWEGLVLFEAVRQGLISTVSERLSEGERKEIRSGAIYIWDEKRCPIRRWTDGIAWSNSRVVGDFLEYRELVTEATAGSRACKYSVKPYGLCKRTLRLTHCDHWFGGKLRLIAYYTKGDIRDGKLGLPSSDPALANAVSSLKERLGKAAPRTPTELPASTRFTTVAAPLEGPASDGPSNAAKCSALRSPSPHRPAKRDARDRRDAASRTIDLALILTSPDDIVYPQRSGGALDFASSGSDVDSSPAPSPVSAVSATPWLLERHAAPSIIRQSDVPDVPDVPALPADPVNPEKTALNHPWVSSVSRGVLPSPLKRSSSLSGEDLRTRGLLDRSCCV